MAYVRVVLAPAAVTVLALAAALGCVPHVAHSPRIESGHRYFLEAGVVRADELQDELQDESLPFLPSMYAGMAHGWTAGEMGPAFLAGVQLPVYLLPLVVDRSALTTLLATSYLDLYAQPRRAPPGGIDSGFGTLLSTGVVMPYVQAGRAGDGGLHTTQAVAVTFGSLQPASYWMPSIAHRMERPDGSRAVEIYANAAVPLGERPGGWFIGFGFLFEIGRKR